MADLYALDTNVYVRALRDPAERAVLKRFLLRVGTRLRIESVVAMELRAGAKTLAQQEAVERLIGPYAERGHVHNPSIDAFLQAGRVLSDLATRERVTLASAPGSLSNDALVAAACREAGIVLVTNNGADFTRIKRHLRGFRFEAPWPRG